MKLRQHASRTTHVTLPRLLQWWALNVRLFFLSIISLSAQAGFDVPESSGEETPTFRGTAKKADQGSRAFTRFSTAGGVPKSTGSD